LHLWLKHPIPDLADDADVHEAQAAAQVREWGFSGIGATDPQERL